MSPTLSINFNMKLFPFFEQAKMNAEVWKKMGGSMSTLWCYEKMNVERKSKRQCYNAEKIFLGSLFISPAQVSSSKFSE